MYTYNQLLVIFSTCGLLLASSFPTFDIMMIYSYTVHIYDICTPSGYSCSKPTIIPLFNAIKILLTIRIFRTTIVIVKLLLSPSSNRHIIQVLYSTVIKSPKIFTIQAMLAIVNPSNVLEVVLETINTG